jgi:hypothetical protein
MMPQDPCKQEVQIVTRSFPLQTFMDSPKIIDMSKRDDLNLMVCW